MEHILKFYVLLAYWIILEIQVLIKCQNSMPKECKQSLGASYGGALSSVSFTATSAMNSNFTASNGRLNSPFAWVPQLKDKLQKKQEYLQVNLGQERTITAVKTQGYMGNYVKKFKLILSLDGVVKNVYQDNHGDKIFEANTASLVTHYICPVVARYVQFVPVEFENKIALKVDIFGCNKTFKVQVANITDLAPISIQQYQITYSWKVSGSYDIQKVFFNKIGEDPFHKTILDKGKQTYQETIPNLVPCTKYKITVAVFKHCKSAKKFFYVDTMPRLPKTPVIIQAKSFEPFTAYVEWKMPLIESGCYLNITGFSIQYAPAMELESYHLKRPQIPSATNVSITGLKPWIKYRIKLFAESKAGKTLQPAYVEVDINGKAPEKAVNITYLQSDTAKSFTIKWKNPPMESVNGEIKGFAIFYRKKSSKLWNSSYPSSVTTAAEISSLATGTTYQVYVVLFNNLYNISSEIREVHVFNRDPMFSANLTKSLHLTSRFRQLTVQWKIPDSIMVADSDIVVVDVRKMGEISWMQKKITNLELTTATNFDGLQEWRVYEAKITVVTKRGIYFSNSSYELVIGQDEKNVVKISELKSTKNGEVEISIKMPKQYITSGILAQTRIRWQLNGSSSIQSKVVLQTSRLSSHIVDGLHPWSIYTFEASIALRLARLRAEIFTSKVSSVVVVGNLPGKPPGSVSAVPRGPNTVLVSWQLIPSEYVNGYLRDYSVYLSSENATTPLIKTVSNSTQSVVFEGLQAETIYFVQVAGRSASGHGPLSDVVTVKTAKEPPPPAPVLIDARAVSHVEILVTWMSITVKLPELKNFTVVVELSGMKYYKNYYGSGTEESKKTERQHSLTLKDLKPSTAYKICMFSTKEKNGKLYTSSISNCISVTTKPVPKPPTPRITSVRPVSSYEIQVTWVSSVDQTTKIENFTVVAVDGNGKEASSYYYNMKSEGDKRTSKIYQLKVKKLQPFSKYKIYVYACKLFDGELIQSQHSNQVEAETKESAPSEPQSLKIIPSEEGYLLVWKAPVHRNGVIRGYHFKMWKDGAKNLLLQQEISAEQTQYPIVLELKPYTKYWVSLDAFTIKTGPAAQLSFVTPAGFPSAPRDVKVILNGTNIIVTWRNPEEENGKILQYKILSKRTTGTEIPSDQLYYAPANDRQLRITDVKSGSKYVFRVWARNSKGEGLESQPTSIYIEPKKIPKPKAPPQPFVLTNKIGSTTMVIKLKPLTDEKLILSLYQVIVEKLKSTSIKKRAVDQIPDRISNYKNATANGERFYIAAEFKANELPVEFIVGDGKTYNGFYNAPLEPETIYKVHVRAGMDDKNGASMGHNPLFEIDFTAKGAVKENFIFGEASSVRSPATAPRKKENKKSKGMIQLPIIAGIAGALLLIIILVAIIIMYLRRSGSTRRQNAKQREEPYAAELAHLRTKMDTGEQRPVSLTGDFPLHPDHPPIGVANYSKYVAKLHRNDNAGFRAEYNQLEMGKEFSWDVAHLTENKPKNRFANIVAYDHARVILTKIPGIPGSDYINASYIDGFLKPNAYVATQGPLPGTFNDFWRMVWELRSSVIVMLTNLQEKNKLKCHKYWPDDCIEYGEVIVTLIRKEMYADYVIRTFILERSDSQETREVKHFHFNVWPDHGVPKYATAILAFKRRVRAYSQPECGPTIVHCSAGVGRTGTYITLDAMLDRINIQGDVDIFNFIAAIRTRRIAMVQTEEQYVFIYDAILEATQCGNTEIMAADLRIMINRLEKVSLDTKMTGFEKEWKTLNNVSPIPPKSSCNIATMQDNMSKNRSQSVCVLPADNSLVRLLTIEDDEATAYINAVYVDGYKQRNAFILTQSPLKNTVVDFWRMLCEHKSASVVLLCSFDEGDDFVKFWPESHIREYEMITVECLSKVKGNELGSGDSYRSTPKRGENELVIRQFKVEDSRYPDFPLMIKLFQYIGWSETKVPSNCNSVIQLINQLERWQQQSGNGPITVICSDGLGRSGTFAALNAVIERVKIEQLVDVFQAIKAMRIQRAHLVKSLEQYRFIYHAVEEYLTAFDDYANFK